MNGKSSIVLALLVTALAVAGSGATGDAVLLASPAKIVEAAEPAEPATPQTTLQPAERAAPGKLLVMPDGTALPPLNDAIDPPKPRWQRGRPYALVIGTVRLVDGRQAYLHADGTRTITFMTFRKDLQREVAVTAVSSPMPTAATLDDENPTAR